MTLSNGSVIASADTLLFTAQMSVLQTQNALSPQGTPLAFAFHGLTATTPLYARTRTFVAPCDSLIDTMAVKVCGLTTFTITTATLTASNPIALPSLTTTINSGAGGTVEGTRTLFRGGRARVDAASLATAPIVRALMQGETYSLVVSTTSVASTGLVVVALALRTEWGRT